MLFPKKADLSPARNWRGTYLPETGSKIPPRTTLKRMQAPTEQVASELQAGFRPERRTTDGPFAVIMGLKKRQEHGLESYSAYVDCT